MTGAHVARAGMVPKIAVGVALLLPGVAHAQQDGPSISVEGIDSAKTCTPYREYSGNAGAVVTPYAAAAYASWRSWLVKDCVDNFASLRMSLEAALAAAGVLMPRGRGGRADAARQRRAVHRVRTNFGG